MPTFQAELQQVLYAGRLTHADLGILLGYPPRTIYGWIRYGHQPREETRLRLGPRLKALRGALRARRGLPVPVTVTTRQRAAYVKRLRHELNGGSRHGGLSKARPAG